MALNRRERRLLVSTITVLVVAASYLLFVPLWRYWQRLGRELEIARYDRDSYQATIGQLSGWQERYDKLRGQFGQQTEQFAQMSDVLKKLEEVAAISGVQISSRVPKPVLERDVYRELPVQCGLEANTESLVKFLYTLRTSSGFINVEKLTVSPKSDNANILRCGITIQALAAKAERPPS